MATLVLLPPWACHSLAAILTFTIMVDIVENVLVILSVLRNWKLCNAGEGEGAGMLPRRWKKEVEASPGKALQKGRAGAATTGTFPHQSRVHLSLPPESDSQ